MLKKHSRILFTAICFVLLLTCLPLATAADTLETEAYRSGSQGALLSGGVLYGVLLPLPLLIVGLVMPRSEKWGRPTYWYALAAVAGAWIALSVLLMAIVL